MTDVQITLIHFAEASAPDSSSPLFDVSLTDEKTDKDLLRLRLELAFDKAKKSEESGTYGVYWFTYKNCVFFVGPATNILQSLMEYFSPDCDPVFVGPAASEATVKHLYDGMREGAAEQASAPYPPQAEHITLPQDILEEDEFFKSMRALAYAYEQAGDDKTVSFELDGQTFYVNQNSAIGGLRIEASRNKNAKHVGPAPTAETADFLEQQMNLRNQKEQANFYRHVQDLFAGNDMDAETSKMLQSIILFIPVG